MKFQDSSFNGFFSYEKCDARMQPRTHDPKAICPINFFKVGGMNSCRQVRMVSYPYHDSL